MALLQLFRKVKMARKNIAYSKPKLAFIDYFSTSTSSIEYINMYLPMEPHHTLFILVDLTYIYLFSFLFLLLLEAKLNQT